MGAVVWSGEGPTWWSGEEGVKSWMGRGEAERERAVAGMRSGVQVPPATEGCSIITRMPVCLPKRPRGGEASPLLICEARRTEVERRVRLERSTRAESSQKGGLRDLYFLITISLTSMMPSRRGIVRFLLPCKSRSSTFAAGPNRAPLAPKRRREALK